MQMVSTILLVASIRLLILAFSLLEPENVESRMNADTVFCLSKLLDLVIYGLNPCDALPPDMV